MFLKIIKKMQTENIKAIRIKDKAADDYNEVRVRPWVKVGSNFGVDSESVLASRALCEANRMGGELFFLVPPWDRWWAIYSNFYFFG